jgi:hypothetical protein
MIALFFFFLLLGVCRVSCEKNEASVIFPNDKNGPDCVINTRDPAPVQKAVNKANALLSSSPSSVAVKDRLLIMILFSRAFVANNHRLDWLRCALLKLQKNLMDKTVSDVFIWGLNTTDNPIFLPPWFNSKDFPRTYIAEIPQEVWRIPCGLNADKDWAARKHFDVDYYLMGRWRLTFSLDFARAMGYEYHLQFDDDAMLNTPVPYNIIEKFNNEKYNMGVFSDLIGEVAHLTLGLPELSSYWLRIARYTPQGTIVNHLKSKDLVHFNSDNWDRMYHPGYFLITRVSWWFSPLVQDYLMTVLRSGKDIEGRWQEQAVMNMMRLIFLPEKEVWVMNEVDIGHDRHRKGNFENWCVKTGLVVPGS